MFEWIKQKGILNTTNAEVKAKTKDIILSFCSFFTAAGANYLSAY